VWVLQTLERWRRNSRNVQYSSKLFPQLLLFNRNGKLNKAFYRNRPIGIQGLSGQLQCMVERIVQSIRHPD